MTVSIFRVSENGGKPHFTRRPKIKGRPRRAAWNKVKALCGVNGAFSVAVNIGRQRGLTALFTGIMETDRFLPVAGLFFLVLFESLDNFPHQAVADNIAVI